MSRKVGYAHFFSYVFKIFGGEIISKSFDKKVDNLVNDAIEIETVLVISEAGEQLGEMSRNAALDIQNAGINAVDVLVEDRVVRVNGDQPLEKLAKEVYETIDVFLR